MTLVTRFSAFFLVALALALGGFSACLYYLVAIRLYQGMDQGLKVTLDRVMEEGPGPKEARGHWTIYDEQGRPVDVSRDADRDRPLDGREPGSLSADVPFATPGDDGRRWRVMLRRFGPGHRRPRSPSHRGPPEIGAGHDRLEVGGGRGTGPGPPPWAERRGSPPFPFRGPLTLAAWAPLAPLEADLRALAVVLTAVSLGLWSLAAAIGRYLGRRALAPLARMAEAAASMSWDDADQRLPDPGTRDELDDFAGSFNGLIERLHLALQRQRQFTGQASHQLRTPLAGLIAAIEVARRRSRTVEEHERVLDRLHGDSLRLWRIVEALLFLARADTEAGLPDLETLDLGAFVEDHLRGWSIRDRAADLQFLRDSDGPILGRAHRALLGQLLDNLLENACKYSPAGEPILVRVGAESGVISLAVVDRGVGVSAEDLPRIFEPFYRSELSRRQGFAGVGLGLAVVRRIASALGGSMTVESGPGRGSRFVLRIPEAAGPRKATPPAVLSSSGLLDASGV